MDFSEIGNETVVDQGEQEGLVEIADMRNEARNAIALAFLDGFYNRVHEFRTQLDEERNNADGDSLPVESSFGSVGLETYQIHSLTVSYFEAATPLLCFHHLHNSTEKGREILAWMNENRDFVFDDDSGDSKATQTMDWLNGRRSSISDTASLVKETGLLSHDKVKRVRSHRHDFLHSPLEMLYISDWEDILAMSDRCVQVIEDMDQRLIEDMNLHAIYGVLTERDRNRHNY